jgi:hypothetical protein
MWFPRPAGHPVVPHCGRLHRPGPALGGPAFHRGGRMLARRCERRGLEPGTATLGAALRNSGRPVSAGRAAELPRRPERRLHSAPRSAGGASIGINHRDDIRAALDAGRVEHAAQLFMALRHFLQEHPEARDGLDSELEYFQEM